MNNLENYQPGQTPVHLGNHVYWVGKVGIEGNLDCNPYLIIEGDEAVLIDPGSPLDFEEVKANVEILVSLDKIKLIIVHHQDPDLCASLPLFEKAGLHCPIALHWRTSVMVQYYGIKNPFYSVNEEKWEWRFSTGRMISFLPASYCHFPGAIMTYDSRSAILFSGDLFGAFIKDEKSIFANEKYRDSMITFHEHYMASHTILEKVMDSLSNLDIQKIAPQHGRIILENIAQYIFTLSQLKCGSFLLGDSLSNKGKVVNKKTVISFLNTLLNRTETLFPRSDLDKILSGSPFHYKNGEISYTQIEPNRVIDEFFAIIQRGNEKRWITILQPFMISLLYEYNLPIPQLLIELDPLQQINHKNTQTMLTKESALINKMGTTILFDDLTGVYNQTFYQSYIEGLLQSDDRIPRGVIYIAIDNLLNINQNHNREAGDETLKSLAYLFDEERQKRKGGSLFKLNNPVFVFHIETENEQTLYSIANEILRQVMESNFFIEPLVLSIGISHSLEWNMGSTPISSLELDKICKAKLQVAKERGANNICGKLDNQKPQLILQKLVLFVEPDDSYIDLISSALKDKGVHVIRINDGAEALDRREGWNPDLIIAEAMTPKVNGFQLKEQLNTLTGRNNTPFILISHRKDEEYIQRAARLRILHYLKKPFSLLELEGLILNLLE